jgi:hypothetical protein
MEFFRDHSPRNRFAIAQGIRLLRTLKRLAEVGRHASVVKEGAVTWTCKSIVPAPSSRNGRRSPRVAFAQVRITGLEDRQRVTLSEDWRCR